MIDVIIPCRNEAGTIGDLVFSLRASGEIGRVIVVDNESSDETAIAARCAGAFVIDSNVVGKGQAIAAGLNFVRTYRVLLCDGDLSPLAEGHVKRLADSGDREKMIIGIPDFTPNVPWARPGALWNWLSGVRSLPLWVLYDLRQEGQLFGYTVEVMINQVAKQADMSVGKFRMHGVKGRVKWGDERRDAIRRDIEWLSATKAVRVS